MWHLRFLCSAILLLSVGTGLFAQWYSPLKTLRNAKLRDTQQVHDSHGTLFDTSSCLASSEAKRSSLTDLLDKVEKLYYHKLHPELIDLRRQATTEDIRKHFRPYDPSPDALKHRTDEAMKLRQRLNDLKFNTTLLKLREQKAFHVASEILLNNLLWAPYSQDYYSGDWLLGPNMFCWEPVCQVFGDLNAVFSHFKPRNMTHLERLNELFEDYNRTFDRYIENWKLGVRIGYVRPFEACKAALHVVKYQAYRGITMNGESGIYNEPFANTLLNSGFFEILSKSVNKTWEVKYQQNVTEYFNQSLLQNIARPVVRMLRYLENEYLRNCPNDENVLSGLGKLPLHYTPDGSQPAVRKLPTGEKLNGPKTYQTLMRFFTTMEITPARLRAKAVTRLKEMYRKVRGTTIRYQMFKG